MNGKKYFTVETLSSCLAIVWGTGFANPYSDLMIRNPSLYAPMLSLVDSELFWGVLYLVMGILGLVANFWNRWRNSPYLPVGSLLMTVTFLSLSALFLSGDYGSNAWKIYGTIAVWNFVHWRYGDMSFIDHTQA